MPENEASCLRPLSAAPRASLALHDRYPREGVDRWTSETLNEIVLVSPPLARRASSWGFVPSRVDS